MARFPEVLVGDNLQLDAKVAVVGVVRNSATTIEADVERISASLAGFSGHYWFVVESDSEDRTVEKLISQQEKSKDFSFESLGDLRERIPSRIQRIAHCRDLALRMMWESCYIDDAVDFVLIVDLDGVNDIIDEASISSCFLRDDWDVCTSNPSGPYYDILALRHPLWCPSDCWEQKQFLERFGVEERAAFFQQYPQR